MTQWTVVQWRIQWTLTRWTRRFTCLEWPHAWIWWRPRIVRCLDELNSAHQDNYALQCVLDFRERDIELLRQELQDRDDQLYAAHEALCDVRDALNDGAIEGARATLERAATSLRAHIEIDEDPAYVEP